MARSLRTTRTAIAALLIIGGILYFRSAADGSLAQEDAFLVARRQAIADAFDHAWSGYATFCMGHDTFHPVSETCDDEFGGWGASAIDALSTAIIMQKSEAVHDILRFIQRLDLGHVKGGESINLFEVTIRHLGGMLSAWELLKGPFKGLVRSAQLMQALHGKMVALGDALSCGFDSASGIPRNWVNPVECHSDTGTSNTLAGAGTLVLEFAKLSEITGNGRYKQLAQRAEDYLINPSPSHMETHPGILGSFIDVHSGLLLDNKGSWGSLADSFYEYLLKAYVYDRRAYAPYLERWLLAADSTIRHLAGHAYGHPDWTFLPFWEGTVKTNAMDALSWFAGGNFILGGMVTRNQTLVNFGLSIADTGGAMYDMTTTGLGGEFVWWTETCSPDWGEDPCTADNSVRLSTLEFNLRPEVLETWYYAYRATKDEKYREWGWSAFQAIEKFCKTNSGFSSISDVTAPDGGRKLDKQESFVYAEVFKYLYLMHLPDDFELHAQDGRNGVRNTWVFNTEGHPLRVNGDQT